MSEWFHGLPVVRFDDGPLVRFEVGLDPNGVDPSAVVWLINTENPDGTWGEPDRKWFDRRWESLIAQPWAGDIAALVVAGWSAPTDELIDAAEILTGLTHLDIRSYDSEASWISQEDISLVLEAYPRLRRLWARGADPTFFNGVFPALEELRLESAGLPAEVIRGIGESSFPALTHLELWLGIGYSGGDATVDDLASILAGPRLPVLTSLGLRDSEITDQIAAALAGAPIVAQLTTLDLSMGTLSDTGAAALLAGQPLTHLTKLDLHHHFLTEEMQQRLRDELEPHGVEVDLSEAQDVDTPLEDRYVAVNE